MPDVDFLGYKVPRGAGVVFRVVGSERVMRALQRASDLTREGIREGLDKGGKTILRRAKENAPVFSGLLRRSITWRITERGPRNFGGDVGSNLFYAKFVELGTRAHAAPLGKFPEGIRWLRQHGFEGMRWVWGRGLVPSDDPSEIPEWIPVSGKPNPFLQSAFDASTGDVRRCLEQGVRGALRRIVRAGRAGR